MSQNCLKVITYNIHKGFDASNRRFVLHGIKSMLEEQSADIVFLQEIQGEHNQKAKKHDNWPEEAQFEFLADELWPHHAYGKNAIYKAGHHGNAILSKYPFSRWENIDVSYMQSASRSLLHGVIEFPGESKPVHLICVHMGLFSYERRQQVAKLVERINSTISSDEPLIIAGDFNDWAGKSDEYLHHHLGVSEAFKANCGQCARTFPAWFPVLSVDRIYSRGLHISHSERLHGKHWRGLSDHLPLLAEYQLQAES